MNDLLMETKHSLKQCKQIKCIYITLAYTSDSSARENNTHT